MHKFHKTISIALAFSLWQFFVPVLNAVVKLPCCEEEDVPVVNMQCCQAEFPSRMVCCSGDVKRGLDESVPLQATSQKTTPIPFDLTVAELSIAFDQTSPLAVSIFTKIDLLNSRLLGNKLYKQLATYLI